MISTCSPLNAADRARASATVVLPSRRPRRGHRHDARAVAADPQPRPQRAHLLGERRQRLASDVLVGAQMPELAARQLRQQREAWQAERRAHRFAGAQRGVGQLQQIDQQQARQHAERDGRGHQRHCAGEAGRVRRQGERNLVRLRRTPTRPAAPVCWMLSSTACSCWRAASDVALHRVQRHLRMWRCGPPPALPIPHILLQRGDAFARGAQLGFGGGDDPGGFRRHRALGVGVLAVQG